VLGSLVLVPALVWMFVLFSRPPRPDSAEDGAGTQATGSGRTVGGARSSIA
jgi:hypothetical protein